MDLEDPEQKCLEVAEKIIACLNDGEILKRYLAIKQKIYQTNSASPQLSPHLKRVALENRELANEVERLRQSITDARELEPWILANLAALQTKVLPEFQPSSSSIDEACEALQKVVDAKTESNNIIRQKMTDDNGILRDKISTMTAAANDELKQSRQRILDADHKFRVSQKELMKQIAQINESVEEQERKASDCDEENAGIEEAIEEKETVAKSLMVRIKDAERRSSVAEKRATDLKRQADRYRRQVEAIERDIEGQRAVQRFGVADVDEEELARLREVEEEVAQLIKENEKLSLNLKKKKLMSGNVSVTELSSIS